MIFPAPQFNPTAYFPGGSATQLQSGFTSYRLPYDPAAVNTKVNQSLAAPDIRAALGAMPQNTGVAFNSPGRAYAASIAAAATQADNAQKRAMMPLQAESANLSTLLNQEAARNAEAAAMAQFGQNQWQMLQRQALEAQQLQDQQRMSAMGSLQAMLSPFVQMMMGG
jgi:hypothetical protein